MSLRYSFERALSRRWSCCAIRPSTYSNLYPLLKTISFSSFVLKEFRSPSSEANKCPCPNVLERNKLQEYLNVVASSNELTVGDIECHKPPKHAPPGTTQYEHDYEKLVRTLSRSFTVKQLKDGHRLFGLDLPKKKTKQELAISIIERQWRWPSLSESLKQQRDQIEVIRQSFVLSKREAFLLLGKGGSNLHKLSSKYNVQTSFEPSPLSLTVQGTRGPVGRVERYMNTFKQDIAMDVLELPIRQDVSPELCQRVSRSSGALVEYDENGTLNQFQISYNTKDVHARHVAKALMMHGAYEPLRRSPLLACISKDNPLPLSMSLSDSSHGFSLYPFTPTRPLPWIMSNARMLRARDVGSWFDHNAVKNPTLLSRDNLMIGISGQVEDIRKRVSAVVMDLFASNTASIPVVQVSFGHFLLPALSTSLDTLTVPVPGGLSLADLLKKVKGSDKQPLFIPSMPKQLLDSLPTNQRLIHRLVYHAIIPPNAGCTDRPPLEDYIKLEFSHPMSPASQSHFEEDEFFGRDVAPQGGQLLSTSEYSCWRESRSHCDLLLPERAMDLRFSVSDTSPVTEPQWSQELRVYKESLQDLSIPSLEASRGILPLVLSYRDATFVLRSSVLVRQSNDQLLNVEGGNSFPPVVSESILDLNSNQRYTTCKLTCKESMSDHWRNLMLACDWLTAHEKSDLEYHIHQRPHS